MSLFKPVVTSAGVLLALSDIAEEIAPGSKFSDHVVTPAFRAGAFIGLIGVFVLALALMQLHNRQTERMGRGALVTALFAGFGTMLLACVTWSTAFLDPAAGKVAPALIDNTPPAILVVGFFVSLAWFGLSWAAYTIVMLRLTVRVLVVSMFEDDASIFTAMRAGARGYILKDADRSDILRAIRAVGQGEAIFSPAIATRLLDYFTSPSQSLAATEFPELTDREREILEMVADGYRNADIARKLVLSPNTVRNYVSSIFTKLQVSDRGNAIIRARKAGLGGPPA